MKKLFISLASIISVSLSYCATQSQITNPYNDSVDDNDIVYIEEEESDVAFDFDYKEYIPTDFIAYDLSDNENDDSQWIDEDTDDTFKFDRKKYLPIGFNPSIKLNILFLDKINWIDEETDIPFKFNIRFYIEKNERDLTFL